MCSVRYNTKSLELVPSEVSYCPLGNCLSHFYQWILAIGPYESTWWERGFCQGDTYTLHFCWSNLMVTGNFSKSAAQFLLVGACGCAHAISCFQDDLSVFKAFSVPIKKYFFWVTSISVKFLCSFLEANQATMPHRAPS